MTSLFFLLFLFLGVQTSNAQSFLPEHPLLLRLRKKSFVAAPRQNERPAQQHASVSSFRRAVKPKNIKKEELQTLPDSVGPLLTDQWDQEGALKSKTPLLNGEHCVVGCVALAMAQVMHKWQYPEWGTGTLTYYDSLGCGQVLTADFSQHRYDWGNMLDKYVDGEYTLEQAEAGAQLCSDCGVSVKMKYGTSSGAQPIMQAISLPTYFGYDESVQIYFRDFYTKKEITEMLKQELASGRPVLISGYNQSGGHAFVIDGYNKDDWFHINVGNPDDEFDGDGWTPLDCMAPNQPKWYDADSPESGLNLMQIFVAGVVPKTDATATHRETHVFAMQRIEAVETAGKRSDRLKVCLYDLSNIGRNLHKDSVSLMLLKDGEIVCPLYTYEREFLLEEIDDTTYTDTLSITIPSTVTAGVYTLQPMFKTGGEWESVRTSTGIPNYLLANLTEDSLLLSGDTANTAFLTLEDLDIPDLILNGSTPKFSLTLKAHNAEFTGRIYLYMEPADERCQAFYLARQGVSLQAGEVSQRAFHKTAIYAPKTGKYRLHFLYDNNLFSDKLYELTDQTIEVSVLHTGVIQLAKR